VPRSGLLTDLAIYIGTSSGNIDVGVYSTAGTRAKLYSTGSIACPTGGQWNVVGALSLAVSAGDQLDLVFAADNATATFGRISGGANGLNQLPSNFFVAPLGAAPKLSWAAAASFALPSSFSEATCVVDASSWAVAARVS
jgi:hypothetical protein